MDGLSAVLHIEPNVEPVSVSEVTVHGIAGQVKRSDPTRALGENVAESGVGEGSELLVIQGLAEGTDTDKRWQTSEGMRAMKIQEAELQYGMAMLQRTSLHIAPCADPLFHPRSPASWLHPRRGRLNRIQRLYVRLSVRDVEGHAYENLHHTNGVHSFPQGAIIGQTGLLLLAMNCAYFWFTYAYPNWHLFLS